MPRREILFEGLTDDQILSLPRETIEELIIFGEPIVFRTGSATVLGSFRKVADRLIIELAQIEGGGEGVLLSLASVARRYAVMQGLKAIEWIVHAVTCAKPNLKLRQVLERRGFVIKEVEGIGPAYHFIDTFGD
jgi:hypothetical protein